MSGVTVPDANPLPGSDLATFVAAMDAASVHGAADALNLTASAVTKRLQSLERRLGVTLFDRGRFGLRSTAAARLLYPEAREALVALQRAEDAIRAHRAGAEQLLPLAASHTVGEFLLPGWLAAFRREEPGVRAQVDVVNSPGVVAAVRDGRAAVGFVEGTDALTGLEALVVREDEIVAVVDAGHRWARRRSVRARELTGEPYFTREQGSGTRAVATAALAAAGIELTPALEVASIQGVKRTLGPAGFALMSALAVEAEERAGTLRAIPVRDVTLTRALRAVRDPAQDAGPTVGRFWDWLRSAQDPHISLTRSAPAAP
jgi:DNA-binding transcriptional LysR family regulator